VKLVTRLCLMQFLDHPKFYHGAATPFHELRKRNITCIYIILWPSPMAARSKVYVCGHSVDGIADSNHAGDIDVCLL
jgi:hypothetical protein